MKHDHTQFTAATAYRAHDTVADRVRRFTPMVRRAAWHIHGAGRDGMEVEDLMQAGYLALTECARNHAGPSEDGFAAYAKIRVRGAMFDLIRKQMSCSRNAAKRRKQAERLASEFYQREGRDPAGAELAQAMGIPLAELDDVLSDNVRLKSIDECYDECSVSFATDLPDPFAVLSELGENHRLGQAMEQLPERLQLVLQLYFVEELNLTEIASVLGVSIPRVHQLKAQALLKLRSLMAIDDG
ncbi:sigma-70 family RNA polymerase sigma factor [Parerythrobacter lacustris]|uniref:Sigma-70 family RNA polymerase sigma factor n=1 Tax=Parerythrobacter lacustris TaxID=2969984 RepID=A0ABT1XNA9_9SPHN|nr:sigma-70 family RNA polymerase sigma factor [Parerythrobacter lacustris]MCR2832754.1 sigma-70 family RNA polymerase sigma factor [Parerythrobacter lacustris]